MKRILIFTLLAAITFCFVAVPAPRAEQQPVTIKLATLAPEGTI